MLANEDPINLSGGWGTIIDAIGGTLGPFLTLMTATGVIVIVMAVFKFMWDKRRGGGMGQGGSQIGWAIALGALLAGPMLLIPIMLTFVDIIANAVVSIFQSASGSS